jgi:hypothetical protein
MYGNGWVTDWYEGDCCSESPFINPQGQEFGEVRVMWGRSFNLGDSSIRFTHRCRNSPLHRSNDLGFRVVVTPPYTEP